MTLSQMPLHPFIIQMLQHYTEEPPNFTYWYGPWNSILTYLFPATDGFQVNPKLKKPDLIIEVSKVRYTEARTLDFQVVLIVKFKTSQQWPKGEAQLFDRICTGKLSAYYSVCPTEAVLDRHNGSTLAIWYQGGRWSSRATLTYSLAQHHSG